MSSTTTTTTTAAPAQTQHPLSQPSPSPSGTGPLSEDVESVAKSTSGYATAPSQRHAPHASASTAVTSNTSPSYDPSKHQAQQQSPTAAAAAAAVAVGGGGPGEPGGIDGGSPQKTLGPKSSYYFGPPGKERAFGTPPCGVIGRDKPREIVRIERDYTTGELPQFHPAFPLELEGRISPTVYSELVNDLNDLLISAHAPGRTWLDNVLAILTFYLSPMVLGTHHGRKMKELYGYIDEANRTTLNPNGLNLLPPNRSALLFFELEYY
ncbi:uncharacterized protein PFL1_06401 [Pseudozyma flocculosa PF-1]|uniref:Ras modification protein ERF4 n=2 Tax=Pseudozyma flocculosa TaxID=84751 RepID=A0A5C3EWD2_9BASI|nr:uncharacterized protein PFL1_06401 [Pseudozyma flocculosa PF-1]EPQ25946.1 hypothetical protein PFL1_06401 [Pseudozyma flocculosa PF-1]SPO35757.1 uncharacterized protein PSFLO_01228 [Pseudozyma flocculosa]